MDVWDTKKQEERTHGIKTLYLADKDLENTMLCINCNKRKKNEWISGKSQQINRNKNDTMDILELKNAIYEIKNKLVRLNSLTNTAEK